MGLWWRSGARDAAWEPKGRHPENIVEFKK